MLWLEKKLARRHSLMILKYLTEYRRAFTADSMAKLTELSTGAGVTLAYALAGVYVSYLAGVTGKPDVVILMPRLNRTEKQRETLGCYLLLTPVRVTVSPDDTLIQICQKTQAAARLSSEHKSCGYTNILHQLSGDPGMDCFPSAYGFNFYRLILESSIRHKVEYSVAGAMQGHFTLNAFLSAEGMTFSFDLRDGVYSEKQASYVLDAIMEILSENRELPFGKMTILGAEEMAILNNVRGKNIPLSTMETIPSKFRMAVSKYADRPAVYVGNNMFTFAELDMLSDIMAYELVRKGVLPGDRIGCLLRRDYRLIPTILGIAKVGAVWLSLDPAYPKERINYMLSDSHVKYLLVSDVTAAMADVETPCLNVNMLMQNQNPEPLPELHQDAPAYIIYTSGTTGQPKGVMLSHRGIVNITDPDNNPFNRDMVKCGTGLTAIGSVSFDIFLFEIFVPLFNGLFIELAEEEAMYDAKTLAMCINRHGANILHCTPSRLLSYLSDPSFSEAIKNVKMVLSAGEVLHQSLITLLRDKYGVRLYNGYGPTEATIGATITEAGDGLTIGEPIANAVVILLNRGGRQVPYGAEGEICIGGAGVGIGYLNRPKETGDVFTLWNGERIYHTGDMGCFLGKRILYKGRRDRQVKLRGLRIELSEIEKKMEDYPTVREAHCLVQNINGNEHLVAFFSGDPQNKSDMKALRQELAKELPVHMVPDALIQMDEMPRTPVGKTDTVALSKIPVTIQDSYRAPQHETEKIICKAYETVLGKERVGLDDNFFEHGGDSLMAVQLLTEIEVGLSLQPGELEYDSLYHYPTPTLLADKLFNNKEEEEQFPIDTLDYTGIDDYLEKHQNEKPEKKNLGNVLLTGVTGYLGIHILMDLLSRPEICGHIYCLSRPKGKLSAEKRVKTALYYYGVKDYSKIFEEKCEVMEGDITTPRSFVPLYDKSLDTIINTAANVAHFAYNDALKETNVDGVDSLLYLARRTGATLCHISTISVGGTMKDCPPDMVFTEADFYRGQNMTNAYIYSKYLAEYHMLRAATNQGVKIKIFRVGNLQGRRSDGEFQMNLKTNAFTRQLSSYIKMGAIPESLEKSAVNFSPVDDTAHRIVSLAATDDSAMVFHVYPPQEVPYSKLLSALESCGHKVRILPDDEFEELFESMKRTKNGRVKIEGLLTERPKPGCCFIPVTQKTTNAILQTLNESWPEFTEEYLNCYIKALDGLNMFEEVD